jgi:hypothetical protein
MPGRLLVCAVALGIAMPAMAGERARYHPAVDTLSLLMLDQGTTLGTAVPRPIIEIPGLRDYDVRESGVTLAMLQPVPADLSGFEAFDAPGATYFVERAGVPTRLQLDLTPLPGWQQLLPRDAVTASNGGRFAVREIMARGRRDYRPGALDAMLQFRLDGQADSPPLSISGGVASAIWKAIPGN